jgi:putative DNA primase/helicase
MSNKPLIANKEQFQIQAISFLKNIFDLSLASGLGEIEIRTFKPVNRYFFNSIPKVVDVCYELCNSGTDVYFGINPRTGKGGKKENVQYVTVFHAEIDYGKDGHRKKPTFETIETGLEAISNFSPKPTMVIHSGGGYHCYWVLAVPLNVAATGVEVIEAINKNLSAALGGDPGTQDISRVLRIPGTYNLKLPECPREVKAVYLNGPKYQFSDFAQFTPREEIKPAQASKSVNDPSIKSEPANDSLAENDAELDLNSLAVSEKIKALILHGNDGSYSSRSEADMAVITSLVHRGVVLQQVREIFENYPIGEKYRQHPKPEDYLQHTIQAAKQFSNLTEAELQNPLFISGSLYKNDKGCHLGIVKFQEYIFRKHKLVILEQEKRFFKYNGQCYEECSDESLNNLCQEELNGYRKFFTKQAMSDLVHYAIGDALVNSDSAQENQVRYLNLQNGLFDLNEGQLINHTPTIFTTNLLPYDYDPEAQCPRFIQFLDEVFLGDQDKISFLQEAVGYAFHKSIPIPTLFFLIGEGSNGKSVFINTLTHLFGERNTSTISLASLGNEYYILGLFGKMINISSETPNKKQINTDIIKAAVAGDWVTGREPYKPPTKFRPYAKHYLAMNEAPMINDNSHGMWRRIYPLEFPRVFSKDEMDTGLPNKLVHELPGIFNWALEGYKRLRDKDFKFEENDSMKIAKQRYRAEADSVQAFIEEQLSAEKEDDKVKFGYVYEIYKAFCLREGFKNVEKKRSFQVSLVRAGFKVDNFTKDNNQVYIFGVKLVED